MSSVASRPPEFPESTPNQPDSPVVDATPSETSEKPPILMGPPKRPVRPAMSEVAKSSNRDQRLSEPAGTQAPQAAAKAPTIVEVIPSTTANAIPPEPLTAAANRIPDPAPADSTETTTDPELSPETAKPRQQPISPPSEPMQYRAIGLLRGRYLPSEEVFNRGQILTQDETVIGAVLLGRVTSLVKKHLDMESSHLWVVYPRTNPEENNALNVQIVGVWEPETLGTKEDGEGESDEDNSMDLAVDSATATALSTESEVSADQARPHEVKADADGPDLMRTTSGINDTATITEKLDAPTTAVEKKQPDPAVSAAAPTPLIAEDVLSSDEIEADYFSIRGEIAKYFEDKGEILVNIMQKVKSDTKQQRPFKLLINGQIEGKTIGYFWDLNVERQADQLVLVEGTQIAAVPPKKKGKRAPGGPRKSFPRKGVGSGAPRRQNGPTGGYRGNSGRPSRDQPSPSREGGGRDVIPAPTKVDRT